MEKKLKCVQESNDRPKSSWKLRTFIRRPGLHSTTVTFAESVNHIHAASQNQRGNEEDWFFSQSGLRIKWKNECEKYFVNHERLQKW